MLELVWKEVTSRWNYILISLLYVLCIFIIKTAKTPSAIKPEILCGLALSNIVAWLVSLCG